MPTTTDFYNGLKTNFTDTVKQSATSEDVIKFIVQKVNEHSKTPFAHMVVKALSFGKPTRDEFIKRVFDYVCNNVDYLRDPSGREVIFTPKLLLSRGKGDCKKQALFIATILKAAGIEPTLKVVSYAGKDWEHIYVTAKGSQGNTIILDPVNDKKFNKEVNYSHYANYYLDGTNTAKMPNELVSMGSKQGSLDKGFLKEHLNEPSIKLLGYADVDFIGKKKHKSLKEDLQDAAKTIKTDAKNVSKVVEKVAKAGEKVGFAPERAAFLGLLKLGEALEKTPLHFRLDQKLATAWAKDPASISKIWSDFGGDPKVLGKTILSSVKTTISAREQRLIAHPFMQFDSIEEGLQIPPHIGQNEFIGQAAAVAGALAAAMPIILAIKKFLVSSKILTPNEANSMDSVLDSTLKLHGANAVPAVDAKGNPIVAAGVATGDKGLTKKKSSHLCTATCEYFGYDIKSNKWYLQLLEFRKSYVLTDDKIEGKENKWKPLFAEYLKVGKQLIVDINSLSPTTQHSIYTSFYVTMIQCCEFIYHNHLELAAQHYYDAVVAIQNNVKATKSIKTK